MNNNNIFYLSFNSTIHFKISKTMYKYLKSCCLQKENADVRFIVLSKFITSTKTLVKMNIANKSKENSGCWFVRPNNSMHFEFLTFVTILSNIVNFLWFNFLKIVSYKANRAFP